MTEEVKWYDITMLLSPFEVQMTLEKKPQYRHRLRIYERSSLRGDWVMGLPPSEQVYQKYNPNRKRQQWY